MMRALLFAALLAFIGCTPSQIQLVNGGISIGGEICTGVVIASGDPALAPICATAEEVAQAIAQLIEQAKGLGASVTPSNTAIYNQILKNRGIK